MHLKCLGEREIFIHMYVCVYVCVCVCTCVCEFIASAIFLVSMHEHMMLYFSYLLT